MGASQYGTRMDNWESEYCMDIRVEKNKTQRHLNALGCLMKFVVTLAICVFFLENEDLYFLSTFSCFSWCWRVSFIIKNKFGAVWEGLESKLIILKHFCKLLIMLSVWGDRWGKARRSIEYD